LKTLNVGLAPNILILSRKWNGKIKLEIFFIHSPLFPLSLSIPLSLLHTHTPTHTHTHSRWNEMKWRVWIEIGNGWTKKADLDLEEENFYFWSKKKNFHLRTEIFFVAVCQYFFSFFLFRSKLECFTFIGKLIQKTEILWF
jgi:hypothetical protein